MQPVIYVDVRCLQDPAYQFRGIGYHTAALLRTRKNSTLADAKMVGLVDSQLPDLPSQFCELFDTVSHSLNPCSNSATSLYIDSSPMTHDGRFGLRFQNHSGFLRAAVLYDFIPLDWPGYLPTVAARIKYLAKVARLKAFHLFFPISKYTASRAQELLGITADRITVTGASVRSSLYEARNRTDAAVESEAQLFFVTLGGDDQRKNTEVAVKAVRQLNVLHRRLIRLVVLGHHDAAIKANLLCLAGHREDNGFLEFKTRVTDEAIAKLFASAIAAIAPSHIEGFSLPIPEASVCGCPVIASTCAAQLELIQDQEALFQPDDSDALAKKLAALLERPELRRQFVSKQAHLGPAFHEDAVGQRFWQNLEVRLDTPQSANIARNRKPLLAFLSPYPPDESGVAIYTANTIRGGDGLFDCDLYTEAKRPLSIDGNLRDAGRVTLAPLAAGRYNGVISVLGNSEYHNTVFEFFERYGGPCILHDARLTQIYFRRLGAVRFLQFAGRLLGRQVNMEEVRCWLQDQTLPSVFVEPIIERASPLIVHTVTQQRLLQDRYGAKSQVAPCCGNNTFTDEELSRSAKKSARERLGISDGTFLVASFGHIARAKGLEACIIAMDFLRSWKIPVELYFVGNASGLKQEVQRVAGLYRIDEHIHCLDDFADESVYRDFLIGSDAGIQLRNFGFGQFSAALSDCISAGLPTVANVDLALSADGPEYVFKVPDRFSPLQIAEQLATVWGTRTESSEYRDMRSAYAETHNFKFYGKRLLEILEIA